MGMKMQRNLTYKIVVTDDDDGNKLITELALPYEATYSLSSNLHDLVEYNELFLALALHPAPSVREAVAWKERISEEVFKILASDTSILVLRSLSRTESFKKYADDVLVRKLIELDSECAQNIASNYESIEQVEADDIANLLMKSRDPSIRLSLAGNYALPKKYLKILVSDRDPSVSQEAKRRLEN